MMAHFRAGHEDEAFDAAPATETSPLGWLLLALVHKSLGNEFLARRCTHEAHESIARQLPTPTGADADGSGDDRPIDWCLIQILLRELQASDSGASK
jgi:hypothetical protein